MTKESSLNALSVDWNLLRKYNVPGPRYTSYPTALEFRDIEDPSQVTRYISERNSEPRPISLYVHIPFCYSLCWYCGCTKVISRNIDDADKYLGYLEKEMDLLLKRLHPQNYVVQLHFGGGTPSFMEPYQIRRLGRAIRERFTFDENAEVSVEIDPRRLSKDHILAFRDAGFNRASLGVQDTNHEVQEAIHRIQPFEQTAEASQWIREAGFFSLNFDLVYGLPKQQPSSFRKTLDDALSLQPDRFAIYSYAHIPWIKPAQKLISQNDLPSTTQKLEMLKMSIEELTANGYVYIGMDHFAREDSELVEALNNGTLQRNFQGYSTHGEADMYAFGMSGISQPGVMHYQNDKELPGYYSALDEDRLPIIKMRDVSQDDLVRRDAIMRIMCKRRLNYEALSQTWQIDTKHYFAQELNQLQELDEDGLVERRDNELLVTDTGQLFLRNIAMVFDAYIKQHIKKRNVYSKTV